MANYAKHEGKNITDGNGVVILYGMIDDKNPLFKKPDYNSAIIYKMGSTPPAYETTMLQYVRSAEGQNAKYVGDILNKYTLSSEYPVSILQYLKNTGKLHVVPTEQIMVVMNSELAFPLSTWVEQNKPVENTGNTFEITDISAVEDIEELENLLVIREEEVKQIKARLKELKK